MWAEGGPSPPSSLASPAQVTQWLTTTLDDSDRARAALQSECSAQTQTISALMTALGKLKHEHKEAYHHATAAGGPTAGLDEDAHAQANLHALRVMHLKARDGCESGEEATAIIGSTPDPSPPRLAVHEALAVSKRKLGSQLTEFRAAHNERLLRTSLTRITRQRLSTGWSRWVEVDQWLRRKGVEDAHQSAMAEQSESFGQR